MIRVKFCGIRRKEDVEAVNRLQPDFAGFVFAKSKRQVTAEQAAELRGRLHQEIRTVAVLVNHPVEQAAQLANSGVADLLQLHGDEDREYIARLKTLTDAKIIKAIRLQGNEADRLLLREAEQADFYLFDTFVTNTYGGTGKTFSLTLLKGVSVDKPFFLAGGLDAENVSGIVKKVIADKSLSPFFYGVDVSGGIETGGYKDVIKMEAFIKVMRR
ncbi:MAG: phosphoribosylanthranilate isomerase [Acidaminococcaceae bacterium]|nr:phosphoribosylanthranilate isomerase [Acidaminococcaceae bacterium]